MKNISQPMQIYCINLPWLSEKELKVQRSIQKKSSLKTVLSSAAAVLLILFFAYIIPRIVETPSGTSRLAVLPLVNSNIDSSVLFFADGMTEQIISSLSNLSGLNVIALLCNEIQWQQQ